MKKDYCSGVPDTLFGIDMSGACKVHDNLCGQAGPYCFLKTIMPFYKALRERNVNVVVAIVITFGGSFFCLLKWPWLLYRKYKYRKNNVE